MKNFFRFLLIVNLCFIAQSNTAPCYAQGAGVNARPAQRAMRLPPTSYAILSPVFLPPVSTSSVDLDIVDRGSNNIGIDPNCFGSQCALPMSSGSYYPANNYAANSANWGNPGAAAGPSPADQTAYGTMDPAFYSNCDPSGCGSGPTAYGACDPAAYGACVSIGACGSYSSCGSTGYSSSSGISSCGPQAAGCSGVSVFSSGCAPCATSCPWSLGGL